MVCGESLWRIAKQVKDIDPEEQELKKKRNGRNVKKSLEASTKDTTNA